MKLNPRVTPTAVDLVKRFEGFRPRAAKTPDGRFTIGYGHVLSPRDSVETAEISEPEADFLLRHDLSVTASALEEALLAPVNDNQFAALLSFAFNIGVENFKGSTAVRHLNQGAYLQAAAALELWRRAEFGGEVMVVDQLVRRRAVEKALFLAPPEGFMPLPSSVLRPSFDHAVVGAAVAWAAARERTAVSRIALEGDETAAELASLPGPESEPAPAAAIAASDALAVRLNRVLPEDEVHREEPQGLPAAEPPQLWMREATAAEPPPVVAPPQPISAWRRRFSAGAQAVSLPVTPRVGGPLADAASSPFDDAFQGPAPHDLTLTAEPDEATPTPGPTPLFERPAFFAVLGLIGVALFIGSIFCMLNRASFLCLLVGVVGVLAMAPAAAFFLFRFLAKPVDAALDPEAGRKRIAELDAAHPHAPEAPHAEVGKAPVPAAEAPVAGPETPEPANDSPFDTAWR